MTDDEVNRAVNRALVAGGAVLRSYLLRRWCAVHGPPLDALTLAYNEGARSVVVDLFDRARPKEEKGDG